MPRRRVVPPEVYLVDGSKRTAVQVQLGIFTVLVGYEYMWACMYNFEPMWMWGKKIKKSSTSWEFHCSRLTRRRVSSNYQVTDHFYWLIPAAERVCWAEAKKTGPTHKPGPTVARCLRKRWLLWTLQVFNCGGHSSVLEKIDVWHTVPKVEWILSQFNTQLWLRLFVFVEYFQAVFELRT